MISPGKLNFSAAGTFSETASAAGDLAQFRSGGVWLSSSLPIAVESSVV
jgi:hypothetical protein